MQVFRLTDKLVFPDPHLADPQGLLAVGGDLSVERLILAYSMGIFPWYNHTEPLLWWSPPVRAVIIPQKMHLARSLKKTIRKRQFQIRLDTCFREVIENCARS